MYIKIPKEDSVVSLLKSYLDINFEVIKKADDSIFVNGNDKKLGNLGPIALLTNFKITTFSGKHLEDICQAHIVSSMYKLITSSRCSHDLFIGFNQDRGRRGDKLTNNKNIKRKNHVRIMLKDTFRFAEQHKKAY